MNPLNHQPGPKNENSFEDLSRAEREKFLAVLKQDFSEIASGKLARLNAFTEAALNESHAKNRAIPKYGSLSHEEKKSWHDFVRRTIVYKFGGYANAGSAYKIDKIAEKMKNKDEARRTNDAESAEPANPEQQTVADYLEELRASISLNNFTSD